MGSYKNSNKLKAVTFSYDDGTVQDIRMIELLNKYGLKSTFNLNSALLGENRILYCDQGRCCQYTIFPEDVKSIYDGHEVAVHTLTHPNLTELSKDEIVKEVEEDRKNLEKLVGYPVVGMAYPSGGVNNDERVAGIIRENTRIQYCRTIESTDSFDRQENLYQFNANSMHTDWNRLRQLAEKFVSAQFETQKIFYIWGHSYEMDFDSKNWMMLEEFFKFISNRSDIYYGTNSQVLL